jgi:hypothetical protein
MASYEKPLNMPEMMIGDLVRFQALFLAIIRFAVEKYGGTMQKDPATGETHLDIPDWAEDVCFQELAELVAPGKPLSGCLAFLRG